MVKALHLVFSASLSALESFSVLCSALKWRLKWPLTKIHPRLRYHRWHSLGCAANQALPDSVLRSPGSTPTFKMTRGGHSEAAGISIPNLPDHPQGRSS